MQFACQPTSGAGSPGPAETAGCVTASDLDTAERVMRWLEERVRAELAADLDHFGATGSESAKTFFSEAAARRLSGLIRVGNLLRRYQPDAPTAPASALPAAYQLDRDPAGVLRLRHNEHPIGRVYQVGPDHWSGYLQDDGLRDTVWRWGTTALAVTLELVADYEARQPATVTPPPPPATGQTRYWVKPDDGPARGLFVFEHAPGNPQVGYVWKPNWGTGWRWSITGGGADGGADEGDIAYEDMLAVYERRKRGVR